jgi:hypothetical protein
MDDDHPRIIRASIRLTDVSALARLRYGDMVKAVVDVGREIMAIGGELHSDEEALLLDDGSNQAEVWGINIYPDESEDAWIEFDSMINVRPSHGNRSRGVDDPQVRERIRRVVESLIDR